MIRKPPRNIWFFTELWGVMVNGRVLRSSARDLRTGQKRRKSTAPAIVAVQSAERGSVAIEVPDFRLGKGRRVGRSPKQANR